MVHRMLNGVYSGDPEEALINLLRSSETMDIHTRGAIADALERYLEGRTDTLRLRAIKPDGGGRTFGQQFDQSLELQTIADQVQALRKAGKSRQQAIGDLIDRGVAKRTKIEEALAYAKRTVVRLSKGSAEVPTSAD